MTTRLPIILALSGLLGIAASVRAQGFGGEADFSRAVSGEEDAFDAEELALRLLNLEMHPDIRYARDLDPAHRLLLMVPRERTVEGPLPLVVWIHGGGWMTGTHETGLDRVAPLVGTGRYAVASIGYRPSSVARWPAQAHDCSAALRWLRAHAEDFDIDPDRIALMGIEAGGHLAAVLGTAGGDAGLEGTLGVDLEHTGGVACVVDLWGPTDFLQMDDHLAPGATLRHAAPGSPEVRLVGGALEERRALVASANPISRIAGPCPPFLILHGRMDPVVPHHQSELLRDALRADGGEATLITLTNGTTTSRGPEIDALVLAFLDHQLHGVGEPVAAGELELQGVRPARTPRGERRRPERPDAAPERDREERTREGGSSRSEQLFARFDRDRDGRIAESEMPRGQRFRGMLPRFDADGDGSLDPEEFAALLADRPPEDRQGGGGS